MLARQASEHYVPFWISHLMRDIKIGDGPKNELTGGNTAKMVKASHFGIRWTCSGPRSDMYCVNLGKLCNLPQSPFPHLYDGTN